MFSSLGSGCLTLSFDAVKTDDYIVEVNNLLGQTIYTERMSGFGGQYSKQINLSESGSGVYFIELKNIQSIAVKKIVVR